MVSVAVTGRPSLRVRPSGVVDVAGAGVVRGAAELVREVDGGSDGEVGRFVAGGGTGESALAHAVRTPTLTAATAGAVHLYISRR
jgi:hypothetical protein